MKKSWKSRGKAAVTADVRSNMDQMDKMNPGMMNSGGGKAAVAPHVKSNTDRKVQGMK